MQTFPYGLNKLIIYTNKNQKYWYNNEEKIPIKTHRSEEFLATNEVIHIFLLK